MSKQVSVDYSSLHKQVFKKAYKLSEVQDRIERVAFDVVRFKDGDKNADLWQIQSADDGDYIVSMYNDEEEVQEKTASAALWDVSIDKLSSCLEVSYKNDPLVRVASSKLGIPSTELSQIESYLPEKLSHNKKLVKALLNELPEPAKKAVYNKYPELI